MPESKRAAGRAAMTASALPRAGHGGQQAVMIKGMRASMFLTS
ncbi:hypothetical protein [Nonomuraea sp. NPDC049400]